MKLHALAVTFTLALVSGSALASGSAFADGAVNSVSNRIPVPSLNSVTAKLPDTASSSFASAPTSTPSCSASPGPAVAACLSIPGLTPEVRALNRLACLLEAVERYKLSAIACAQRRVNEWQETVIWPRSVLASLRTAYLARVKTLREQYEDMVDDWSMPTATQSLASIYGSPKIVMRSQYESVWGRSRGPASDIGDVASWLSVTNRNTIQGRTSAAFGIAGELPENTWERIGREGARVLAESKRDPLAALRHTPQMLADRARVEANTLRMQSQALVTSQVRRDFKRYKKRRDQALGTLWLRMLAGPHVHDAPPAALAAPLSRPGARS